MAASVGGMSRVNSGSTSVSHFHTSLSSTSEIRMDALAVGFTSVAFQVQYNVGLFVREELVLEVDVGNQAACVTLCIAPRSLMKFTWSPALICANRITESRGSLVPSTTILLMVTSFSASPATPWVGSCPCAIVRERPIGRNRGAYRPILAEPLNSR